MGLGLYDPEDLRGCYVGDCIMDSYSGVMDKAGATAFAPEHEKEDAMQNFLGSLDKLLSHVKHVRNENNWKYASGDDLAPGDFCVAALYFNFAKNDKFEAN
jgi:hypothetical protein